MDPLVNFLVIPGHLWLAERKHVLIARNKDMPKDVDIIVWIGERGMEYPTSSSSLPIEWITKPHDKIPLAIKASRRILEMILVEDKSIVLTGFETKDILAASMNCYAYVADCSYERAKHFVLERCPRSMRTKGIPSEMDEMLRAYLHGKSKMEHPLSFSPPNPSNQ